MDNITNKFKSILPFPTNLNNFNYNHYSSISVTILIALALIQLHLVSHVVVAFPSAISKQSQQQQHHHHNSPGGLILRRSGQRNESLLERIDIDSYLKNHKALKLQMQCLVHDGPCDFVGRWLKPRIRTALLGECYSCSEKQKAQVAKIVDYIQQTFPEEFKMGVKKYLFSVGFSIPEETSTPIIMKKEPSSTFASTTTVNEVNQSNANNTTKT